MPPVRSRAVVSLVALGLVLLGCRGSAQADIYPDGWEPLPGSVQAAIAEEAARKAATVYGTAASLERNVFPMLASGERNFVFAYEQNWLFNVVHIPMRTDSPLPEQQYQAAGMTTYSGSVVVGGKVSDAISIFYGTSLSMPFFPGATDDSRFVASSGVPLGLMFYQGPTAPLSVGRAKLLPRLFPDSSSADFLLGANADVGGSSLYLGYLGSTLGDGIYTNITENKLRLLLAAALAGPTADDLLYLKAGFDRAKGLLDGELFDAPKEEVKGASKTSLFARRVQFLPPQPSVAAATDREIQRLNFWTTHAEQLNIGGILDASLAVGVEPFLLHEAKASIHTTGYNEPSVSAAFWDGIQATVGMVQLPRMTYFAQQGGPRLLVSFEAKAGKSITLSVRRNDPSVLSVFPYAYDAWNLYISVAPPTEKTQ